jgi:poly-D-alanine transfer protein DltD
LANALAGKTVSALPILISLAIFIITIIVVVSIVYAMVRSSIISVGRNPMSQSAIYRDIIQLSALVLAILAVGVISIFLVLTRM